jgi:hypothetical protein
MIDEQIVSAIAVDAMKKPCKHCPFLVANNQMLTPGRRQDLLNGLTRDRDFPCHETVDYSGESGGRITADSRRCTGAAIFMENAFKSSGGMLANVSFRMAARFGEIDRDKLDLNAPVFRSVESWLRGTATNCKRPANAGSQKKPIRCLKCQRDYESIVATAAGCGYSISAVKASLRRDRPTLLGHRWVKI